MKTISLALAYLCIALATALVVAPLFFLMVARAMEKEKTEKIIQNILDWLLGDEIDICR